VVVQRGAESLGRDVLTVPNALSALGVVLTVHGARRLDTASGLTEVVLGRLLDLADGEVARAIGQSSDLGAGLDALFDKAGLLAVGVVAWRKRLAPRPVLAAIAVQNLVNSYSTALIGRRHHGLHQRPVLDGKRAMGYQNAALAAYLLRGGPDRPARRWRLALTALGHLSAVLGVGRFGTAASAAYLRRARSPLEDPPR
jgi:phosphatidylglycerophosphate synthase